MKFWNWVKNEQSGVVELLISGNITDEKWYENDVTYTEFYKEMKAAGEAKEYIVRINSGGGDVSVAVGIYSLLRDVREKVTVIIDGYAASAATVIAMAGKTVKISKAGIFMIHNPAATLWGRYGAEELTKAAKALDKYKETIISAYEEKTGLSREEISELMSEESYMTGEEAVEAGFCDELIEGENSITVNNKGIVFVNQVETGKIPVNRFGRSKNKATAESGIEGKEKRTMEIKTTAELKKAYPQLCEEIAAEATNAERERIKGIENTTIPGFEDMANKAKFENITDEAGFAVMCLKAQKEASQQFEGVRAAELTNSGAGQVVSPREPEGGAEEENEILAAARKIYGKEKK